MIFKKSRSPGNVMIPALFATALVAGMAVTVTKAIQESKKLEHYNRVKAAIAEQEKTVRRALLTQASYPVQCTPTERLAPPAGMNCLGKLNFGIQALQDRYSLPCQSGGSCLIKTTINNPASGMITTTNRTVTFTLTYTGTDVNIKPYTIAPMTIPDFVFNGLSVCVPPTPIFKGYDSSGHIICSPSIVCGPGQYIQSINASTMAFTCQDLGTTPVTTCAPNGNLLLNNQLIDSISWNSNSSAHVSVVCDDRTDPPIDCIGGWGACSVSCRPPSGTQTFTITQDASGGGVACSASSGQTRTCNPLPPVCSSSSSANSNSSSSSSSTPQGCYTVATPPGSTGPSQTKAILINLVNGSQTIPAPDKTAMINIINNTMNYQTHVPAGCNLTCSISAPDCELAGSGSLSNSGSWYMNDFMQNNGNKFLRIYLQW